jgi:hypothetical protein
MNAMTARMQLALHGLAVFLLSAYPLSVVARANLGVVPIRPAAILFVLAINLVLVVVLDSVLRLVTRDVGGRAAWLSVFFIVFGGYRLVLEVSMALGWPLMPDDPVVAITFATISAVVATMTTRPWRVGKTRDPIPFVIVGVVLVGTNVALGLSRLSAFSSADQPGAAGWQRAASDLIAQAMPESPSIPGTADRDIYYIILDGFGRSDTMARLYDVDLKPFVASLEAKGFTVPAKAATNYAQTYLSIASALNLGYLDGIAAAVGTGNVDRNPLAYVIDRNALMQLARRRGYQLVHVGSDFTATESMSSVDVCLCTQYGSGSAEQALFAANPLAAFVLGPRFFGAHRRKVLEAFEALHTAQAGGRPSFVFAHLVFPHPPFVFNADGSTPPAFGPAMFQDGSHYSGSRADYRRGYRGQVQYLTHRLTTIVDALLSRPGPQPVIVIHGDHGPGLGLNWESAEQTDMAERTGIFAAYYFPNATTLPYPTITPVNAARLLANAYLGTSLPRLEDRTYFSTWGRPYDFIEIDTEHTR